MNETWACHGLHLHRLHVVADLSAKKRLICTGNWVASITQNSFWSLFVFSM